MKYLLAELRERRIFQKNELNPESNLYNRKSVKETFNLKYLALIRLKYGISKISILVEHFLGIYYIHELSFNPKN